MDKVGLYFHIPYCSFMCHYCDFVKTARWDEKNVEEYFHALQSHFEKWLPYCQSMGIRKFTSIYFGGGTPSLFEKPYANLFKTFAPFIEDKTEISLEANPEDLSLSRLRYFKDLGFNRISLGVQTFNEDGNLFLTRIHKVDDAKRALERTAAIFANFNIDLMYGYPKQSLNDCKKDLEEAISFNPTHLSLYNLTYADKTPIGRAYNRGKLPPSNDEIQEKMYQEACRFLASKSYQHDEVSNWCKPGYSCTHNWLYWQGGYYLGIGAGAFGHLPETDIGIRYSYPASIQAFLKLEKSGRAGLSEENLLEKRSKKILLFEIVAAGLRSSTGIDLKTIQKNCDAKFIHNEFIINALKEKKICLEKNRLILKPEEWFRENAWCDKILECFILPSKAE